MTAQPPTENSLNMDRLLDEADKAQRSLERGQIVDGVIMRIDREQVLVNVGQKTEGILPAREMRSLPPEAVNSLKVGDSLTVAVIRPESEEGHAILSVDRARRELAWRTLQEYADKGSIVDGVVTGHNRGGAVVTVEGIQGFVPLSQLVSVSRPADPAETPNLSGLVGKTLKVKVIEVSRRRNRAIFSERAAIHEYRQTQKARLLGELKEGEVRKGRISGVTPFGAFVDLGGADGLIHISELSWEPVGSPQEVVKVGDEVDVQVLKVDRESKRIALSLKRTQPEPWYAIVDRYQVGQVVEATITKLTTFGAFARLQGPVEGLIHISELSDRVVQHPREVVREGDRIPVKIVKIEPERRRIGLSIKQVKEIEAAQSFDRYRGAEGEHRVEQPALSAGMAAQLTQAVTAGGAGPSEAPVPGKVTGYQPSGGVAR